MKQSQRSFPCLSVSLIDDITGGKIHPPENSGKKKKKKKQGGRCPFRKLCRKVKKNVQMLLQQNKNSLQVHISSYGSLFINLYCEIPIIQTTVFYFNYS